VKKELRLAEIAEPVCLFCLETATTTNININININNNIPTQSRTPQLN